MGPINITQRTLFPPEVGNTFPLLFWTDVNRGYNKKQHNKRCKKKLNENKKQVNKNTNEQEKKDILGDTKYNVTIPWNRILHATTTKREREKRVRVEEMVERRGDGNGTDSALIVSSGGKKKIDCLVKISTIEMR